MKRIAFEVPEGIGHDALMRFNEIITQAYREGFREGFSDGFLEGKDFIVRKGYVDLGLPSGTLWSNDYLRDTAGNLVYLSYDEAARLCIPTKGQWNEIRTCSFGYIHDDPSFVAVFDAMNKRSVRFYSIKPNGDPLYFWLKEDLAENSATGLAASLCLYNGFLDLKKPVDLPTDTKLPVRLVKK